MYTMGTLSLYFMCLLTRKLVCSPICSFYCLISSPSIIHDRYHVTIAKYKKKLILYYNDEKLSKHLGYSM